MGVKFNNNDIADIKVGTSQIESVYLGSDLLWEINNNAILLYSKNNTPYNCKIDGQFIEVSKFTETEDGNYVSKVKLAKDSVINLSYFLINKENRINAEIFKVDASNINNTINDLSSAFQLSTIQDVSINCNGGNLSLGGTFSAVKFSIINDLGNIIIKNANITKMNSTFWFARYNTFVLENCSTEQCTDFSNAFNYCYLTNINSANIKVSGLCTDVSSMFSGCKLLENIDISEWNLINANKTSMFQNCTLLTTIGTNTISVNGICSNMFSGCNSLEIEEFKLVGTPTKLEGTFNSCVKIKVFELTDVDFSNNVSLGSAFCNCTALEEIKGLDNKTINPTSFDSAFSGCSSLQTLGNNLTINLINCSSCANSFLNCNKFASKIKVIGGNNITNASSMFCQCNQLTNIDTLDFTITDKCKDLSNMFNGCKELISLSNLSSWDTKNVTSIQNLFMYCYKLDIDTIRQVENWNMSNVENMLHAFRTMNGLKGQSLTLNWNTPKCKNFFAFNNLNALAYLDISSFDTSAVTNGLSNLGCYAGPRDVKVGTGYFNSNAATLCVNFTMSKQNVLHMLNCLLNHPKTEDDNWEGQTIKLDTSVLNEILSWEESDPDSFELVEQVQEYWELIS